MNGRLVSLVDGREYSISTSGFTFGREVGCDIVIASSDVSRRHAEISPAGDGYLLTDLSTNGVLINGSRVEKTQVLDRGDVLRIGPEEFRFYADASAPQLANTGFMPRMPASPTGKPVPPAPAAD